MSENRRAQTDKLLRHLEEVERENRELARTADELRARFEERLQFKDETIRNLNSQIDDLQALLQNAQKPGRGVEQQLEELRRENGQLRDQLNSKFFKELGDDALSREVAAIRDPGSFAAVKTILAKMTKQREEIQRLNEQIASSGDLQKSLTDLTTKYKQKDTEVKTLTSQIKSQHIQIEFLQREYDFMQNKIAQGKPVNIPAPAKEASASQITQASDFYVKSVKEVCSILKIKDESKLVNSIKIIEEAYQLLPSLQNTVETIFKIVYDGNIFDTPLNSYDDLSDAVENWATNLQDYKNLVDGLLEILEVEAEENKTVSYIVTFDDSKLETISRMKNRSGAASHAPRQDNSRSDSDQLLIILKEMLRQNSKEGVLDSVASLIKKQEAVSSHLKEVKEKLGISSTASDDLAFSRMLRYLNRLVDN